MLARRLRILLVCLFCSVSGLAQDEAGKAPGAATPGPAVSYGLVIDNSGSLRLSLDRVIRIATTVVKGADPSDEGFLVTFVDSQRTVLRQEFTSSTEELVDAIENMYIEGGQTALLDAVMFAAIHIKKNARPENSRLIVLITDGDERQSETKMEDLLKVLKDERVRILAVGISDEKVVPKVLDRLTKDTGGIKFQPRTAAETSEIVTKLAAAIRAK